jgi:ribosome-associated protein
MATKRSGRKGRSGKDRPKPLVRRRPGKAARAAKAPPARMGPPGRRPRGGKEEVLAHHASRAAPQRAGAPNPTALAIASAGLDKKAEDVTVLDVRGLTSYADFFVIMTADSDRQASAIADHVEQTMKARGVTKVGVEGYETGRWILVDYGDVVAHVMSRDSREFYDLEGLWADAPRLQVEG